MTRSFHILGNVLVLAACVAFCGLAGACSSDDGAKEGTDLPAAAEDAESDLQVDEDTSSAVSDQGAATDLESDVPDVPEIDWESLPRLPEGKTFTTRFIAGAAEADITPDGVALLGGFGFCLGNEERCRKSEGVHDPLKVGVVAIGDTETGEVVMFAGLDSSGMLHHDHAIIHKLVQQRLYDDFGVYFQGQRIVLTASHSHAAPDMVGLWGPMGGYGRDEDYAAHVQEQAAEAASEAFAAMGDIEMTWARGSSPNKTDGSDPETDDELIVILGKRPGGEAVFTLSRWNSHPTAYGSDNNGISADWWGPLRKMMAEEFGGIAVHLTGAIGGTYPERPEECGLDEEAFPDGWMDPDLTPTHHMKVTCTGKLVFDNAVEAMKEAKPVEETGIDFRYKKFGFHPDNKLLMLAAKMAPAPFEWVDVEDHMSEMRTEMGLYRVGNLTFVSTPGEAFPEFAHKAQKLILDAGLKDPVVLGLANDWLGYLLTEPQWKDEELSYHQGLSCGRKIDPKYMEALAEVLESL